MQHIFAVLHTLQFKVSVTLALMLNVKYHHYIIQEGYLVAVCYVCSLCMLPSFLLSLANHSELIMSDYAQDLLRVLETETFM
jgi:hypothetical protein